jgi:hypothetical protein
MAANPKHPKSSAAPAALPSSFRDPAGYMYRDGKGRLLRRVTSVGIPDYEMARDSGLYAQLHKDRLLVPHREVSAGKDAVDIAPEELHTVSYPFEWSFSMLRDAALATLAVQKVALAAGMSLKDASAYNVQFMAGRPVLIDTLSLEPYKKGEPWVAYGQFCRHFLAPLALMAHTDIRLSQLSREYIDGVPLDLASVMLPRRALYRPGLLMHIAMHARAQQTRARDYKRASAAVSQTQLHAILDNLERTIRAMRPRVFRSEWMDYYENTNYSDRAAKAKQKLIAEFTTGMKLKSVLDLGGNDGHYSQAFADRGIDVVCPDIDPHAVEYNYRRMREQGGEHMLPLLVDFLNPGGAIGWANEERAPVHERLQADLAMALALIHHICISNNVPFGMVSEYFSHFAPQLVIEFVPKKDSQVQKLLSTRKDIFPDYDEAHFEAAFSAHYKLVKKAVVAGSARTLYLFKRK